MKKGDILSQIALDHLGNAHRYPGIFKASRGIHQPGGQRLTDPDVIDIGWKLNIPTPHPDTDKPTKKHEARPAAADPPRASVPRETVPPTPVTPPASPAQTGAQQPPGSSIPTMPVSDRADADAESPPPWLLTGLADAGALLAGALWLILLRRRAIQHHHRRPGFTTAPPPPHTIPVEKTLRHQGRPASELLTLIDETLRRLAAALIADGKPLPILLALAATPTGLRVHLAEDAVLPRPWQQQHTASVWSLDVTDIPGNLEALEPDGPAPWPHLATVGADDTGRWWLLNLEVAGITAINGDPDYATDLARYLSAELATTPWSRDIQVDLIGIFDELAGINPRRIRHHPTGDGIDDSIAAAVDTIDRLARLHIDDLPAARAAQAGDEIWLNRVLVTAGPAGHFDQLAQLIRDQPRRTAVAALIVGTATTAAPALDITVGADGRAHVPALGLDLVANGITPDEARGCTQLLQAADQLDNTDVPIADGDGWRRYTDRAGRLRPDFTQPRHPEGDPDRAGTNLPQRDSVILDQAATTSDDLAVLAPAVPEPTRQQIADDDPTLDTDLADWHAETCARPRLSVLGPMKVRLGQGGQPAEAAKRRPYYTELVAYLATRPDGATTAQLCTAFAATPARLQRDLGVVRKWLGADPATRERHLPDATRSSLANDGHGVYQLHDVLYDADLFRRLRLRGQTRGADGLADYLQALSLVSGTPYTQLRPGGGIWLSDDRDDQHLLVAIIDTAHLAVTMALQAGDLHAARRAAQLATTVAPDEEMPKLDLAAIARAGGDTAASEQITAAALQQRDADGPIELDSRTSELINSPGWRKPGTGTA